MRQLHPVDRVFADDGHHVLRFATQWMWQYNHVILPPQLTLRPIVSDTFGAVPDMSESEND
jgi:hypothetical protein